MAAERRASSLSFAGVRTRRSAGGVPRVHAGRSSDLVRGEGAAAVEVVGAECEAKGAGGEGGGEGGAVRGLQRADGGAAEEGALGEASAEVAEEDRLAHVLSSGRRRRRWR